MKSKTTVRLQHCSTAGRTPPFLIVFALGSLALCQTAQAVNPAPDGAYPGGNTAEGQAALLSLTTGGFNTAVGFFSLRSDTTGQLNTAIGAGTLLLNTGDENTATGAGALFSNTTGSFNTANGSAALDHNTTGNLNTAIGEEALFSNTEGARNTATGSQSLLLNTTGTDNTADGSYALVGNTTGNFNTANGDSALFANTTGSNNAANGYGALLGNTTGDNNTATGYQALINNNAGSLNTATGFTALFSNTTGGSNTAVGDLALYNNTAGTGNVALGADAGFHATTGNGNVYIGAGMEGVADESDHTYIRNINSTSVGGGGSDFVTVDLTTGLLGHASSSRRYKEDIKSMDNASEALFALNPVTFRYKKDIDKSQSLQYGLVAEDVAQVDPDLAIRDAKGQIENVRYSAVNAMLLNEFLKEHRRMQKLEAALDTVNTRLEKQAAQIQKVTAQVDATKPLPHLVLNNP